MPSRRQPNNNPKHLVRISVAAAATLAVWMLVHAMIDRDLQQGVYHISRTHDNNDSSSSSFSSSTFSRSSSSNNNNNLVGQPLRSASIQVRTFHKPLEYVKTPNFMELLNAKLCNVSQQCNACLQSRSGGSCDSCGDVCRCLCASLCQDRVEPKFVAKEIVVTPLPSRKDKSQRLIPRIIHQTWFEPITREAYPTMSRWVESFQHQDGWEYRFYTDKDAADFLSRHFPPEVREAFEALLPGALKSDLFRCAVLLIDGGLYADVDVQLEYPPDQFIAPDVGFMVPRARATGRNYTIMPCALNAFMASAPGHPFLAKALEKTVNQVRNRFTVLDFDASYCPSPDLLFLHEHPDVFTTGPCLLGAAMNQVLGREPLHHLELGDLLPGSAYGRTVILKNYRVRGATNLRWSEGQIQITVARTKFRGAKADPPLFKRSHYTRIRKRVPVIFGLQEVYKDRTPADEDIRIIVRGS